MVERKMHNGRLQIDEIPHLFAEMVDPATKAGRRERLVRTIVDNATIESFDCLPIFRTLRDATELAARPDQRRKGASNLGIRVIEGIEGYFEKGKFVCKDLTRGAPITVPIARTIVDELNERFDTLGQYGYKRPPLIDTFIERIVPFAEQGQTVPNIMTVIDFCSYTEVDHLDSFITKGPPNQLAEAHRMARVDGIDRHRLPEKVISIFKEASPPDRECFPDFYTFRCYTSPKDKEGVSLQDIVESPDQEEFNTRALKLLASFPRGDVFWQRIIESIYTSIPYIDELVEGEVMFEDADFSIRLYTFQQWLSQKLFFPALNLEERNREVDQRLRYVFERLDPKILPRFVGSLYSVLASYQYLELVFYDKAEEDIDWSYATKDGIKIAGIDNFPRRFRQEINAPLFIRMMENQADAVALNLTSRFVEHPEIASILTTAVQLSAEQSNSEHIISSLRVTTTQSYGTLEALNAAMHTHENLELEKQVWEARRDENGEEYYYLEFPEGDMPRTLGIASIDVYSDTDVSVFAFEIVGEGTRVVGIHDIDPEIVSIVFSPQEKGIEEFLTGVAGDMIQDLGVYRQKKQEEKKLHRLRVSVAAKSLTIAEIEERAEVILHATSDLTYEILDNLDEVLAYAIRNRYRGRLKALRKHFGLKNRIEAKQPIDNSDEYFDSFVGGVEGE